MKNQNKKYYKQLRMLRDKNGDDPWNEIKLAHKFKKVKRNQKARSVLNTA
jgi:hypothetical protein